MTRNVWKTFGLFTVLVSAPMPLSALGFAEGIPEGWSCEGNCGTSAGHRGAGEDRHAAGFTIDLRCKDRAEGAGA